MTIAEILQLPEVVWFLLGLLFFVLELMIPGLIMLFFGVGAWITSILCLTGDYSLTTQLTVFILSSVISLAALRRYLLERYAKKDVLSDDNYDIIGQAAVAETNISEDERGKVTFKGASWQATSKQKIKKGDRVVITGKQSIVLEVKPQ